MKNKLRVVLDTNVIVSGFISPHGPPGKILKALRAKHFQLITSSLINNEIMDVMERPQLQEKYGLDKYLFDVAYLLWGLSEIIKKTPPIKKSRDSDDDKFLSTALGGNAHYLVSGDHDLLALKDKINVSIVTPAEFVKILTSIEKPS